MLKGESKITVTHETIRRAVEEYLRRGLKDGDRLVVQRVTETPGKVFGSTPSFDVEVAEPAEPLDLPTAARVRAEA